MKPVKMLGYFSTLNGKLECCHEGPVRARKNHDDPWRDVPTFPVFVIPLDAKSVEELRLKVKLGMGKLLGSEWFTDEATFLALEALGITAKQPRAAVTKYHKKSAVIPTGGKVSQPRAGRKAKL